MRTVENILAWQNKAMSVGRSAQYFLIKSPGGAGKSLLQVMLAQADIEDASNKQLILVPKNHIHYGFFDDKSITFTLPGQATPSHWQVKSNFCEQSSTTSKVQDLKKFLLADSAELAGRGELAAIATHNAMVLAWRQLSDAEKQTALQNISFRIDEAHHLSHVFDENDLSMFEDKHKGKILGDGTGLGRFVQEVLSKNVPSVKVHLATATFFRGDRRTILSESFRKQFVEYSLPWDEHFESLEIKHLEFDYFTYENDPIESVLTLVRAEPKQNHLIIIPPMGIRFRTAETLPRLIEGLNQIVPPDAVLDLVTRESQDGNKAILNRYPDKFRVVVACRLFDEGTDWVPCNRMHNTDACEGSLTLAVQRIFRPLRRYPAKDSVQIVSYLPRFSTDMSDEEKRQALSNRFNAYLAALITQGEFRPTLVKLKWDSSEGNAPKTSTLQGIYGTQYPDVMETLLKEYESVTDKHDPKLVEEVAERVMEEFGIPDNVDEDELKDALLRQLVRIGRPKKTTINKSSLEFAGIDTDLIRQHGFDKVWAKEHHPSSVLCMGTDNIDSATIREFLTILRQIPTLAEIERGIVAYHARTGTRPRNNKKPIPELNRSGIAVDRMLRKHHGGLCLVGVSKAVLGSEADVLLRNARQTIRKYWEGGEKVRLTISHGFLPEMGMTTSQLNEKLRNYCRTTLAKQVTLICGPQKTPWTIRDVWNIAYLYLGRGIRLSRDFGPIPELGISSFTLDGKLKARFGTRLAQIVKQVEKTWGAGAA